MAKLPRPSHKRTRNVVTNPQNYFNFAYPKEDDGELCTAQLHQRVEGHRAPRPFTPKKNLAHITCSMRQFGQILQKSDSRRSQQISGIKSDGQLPSGIRLTESTYVRHKRQNGQPNSGKHKLYKITETTKIIMVKI